MAFSSLEFLYGFLPVVLVAFAILRGAARNILILCASLAFYAWTEGAYATVLLVYIFGNWALGLAIERAAPQTPARIHLTTMAVIANLAGLVIFKYAGFLTQGVGQAFAALGLRPPPRIRAFIFRSESPSLLSKASPMSSM